jgi:ornithine cyclodeaminase
MSASPAAPVILTEAEIRRSVGLDASAITAVERAFAKLASERVVMPPVHQILVAEHHGQTCVKSAYVAGDPFFVAKAASTFHDNAAAGLSNTSGLMMVFQAATGFLDTLLLDNGWLTAVRTAAAGAVAAKWLARRDASSAAILGAGKQARLQLKALTLVRPVRRAAVWARDADAAVRFAREMSAELELPVTAAPDVEACVRDADLIVTTTPARAPILRSAWVAPGAHVTAMGSDAPGKVELEPALLARARPYVCDSRAQCRELGEWAAAIAAGAMSRDDDPPELGEIIVGRRPLERGADDVTVCDLTGLGVQDAEIALLARERTKGKLAPA